MTSAEIRQSFLDFFQSKQHTLVPSASLMPDSPNLLFTNAGMNQFVPIFLGERQADVDRWPGATPGPNTVATRAADTQKCIRAGGKHNDLEDVGLDTYHHTFFEMLGNWSFGDYFKREAIEWAWELLTKVWGFPKERLYATVYQPGEGDPAEFDQEAWDIWARLMKADGLDPEIHIVSGNKKDNFWMMGETGPCGPCSEVHIDLTPAGDTGGSLVNAGSGRCIEIWNLVFIQFNANPDGTFSPLPARHVDTGMGFERVAGIMQGTQGFTQFDRVISNYESDAFRPLFERLEVLSGMKYQGTLPAPTLAGGTGDPPVPVGDPPTGTETQPPSPSDALPPTDAPPHSAGLVARRDGPVASSTRIAPGATYSRRNLPHFEKPWAIYHVIINTIAPRRLSPAARDVVFDCILHWRDSRYRLVAACVLPDHAHFIIQPGVKDDDREGNPVFWALSEILHSIKSYSAKEVNKLENVTGTLWQEERYDRYVRSDRDLEEKFHYLCRNPWTAGLASENEAWPWLWTPGVEAEGTPAAPGTRGNGMTDLAGGTGDPPVPVGDPPTGTETRQPSPSDAPPPRDAPSHSAGLVARRDGPVARSTRPGASPDAEQIAIDVAFRVIADHIRTLSFAIADGIQPGNTDRNYVLRRILRRAVRYGRTLGLHEPFFYKLVDVLADSMGEVFPEIRARQKQVAEVIRREEEAFNKTLDRGIARFEEMYSRHVSQANEIARAGAGAALMAFQPNVFIGDYAFELYDTYGFPLDLTELMARERGLTVDTAGFEKLMDEQRARARAAQKREVIELSQIDASARTEFVGFDTLETLARVLDVARHKDRTAVVLDTTACYAEMGGQVGDTGELEHGTGLWRVTHTQKSGDTWLHFIEEPVAQATSLSGPATRRTEGESASPGTTAPPMPTSVTRIPPGGSPGGTGESPVLPRPGIEVLLRVDTARRQAIQRHHTVTHLLHWALHEVVSHEAAQKGSFVGPDKLTFDFNSAPLTPTQVADIEQLVNERIVANAPVSWIEVKYDHIRQRDDIMQFFGEKYGEWVRVVQIGGEPTALNGYSMELCGGTHTRATGEIGLFRIVGESAIAAGIRRIEAVAGLEAYRCANEEMALIKTLAGRVNSPVAELEKKVEALLAHQKELEKQLKAMQQAEAHSIAQRLMGENVEQAKTPLVVYHFDNKPVDYVRGVGDALKAGFEGTFFLTGSFEGSVAMVSGVSSKYTRDVQAGALIKAAAPILGGKGGGRPDFAQGGGKDVSKVPDAQVVIRKLMKLKLIEEA